MKRTKAADLDAINLWPKDQEIPEDLLGNKKAKKIQIFCHNNTQRLNKIHPDAFRSSADYTVELYLRSCDLAQMDLTFLTGFIKLDSIRMARCANIHRIRWDTMPDLPRLSKLEMLSCKDLNQWTNFPRPRLLKAGFYEMKLNLARMEDETVDRILDWVLKHSADSLHKLEMSESSLTRIPKQLSSFTKLHHLDLQGQSGKIGIIPAGALVFPSQVTRLWINNCGVDEIEPGAIKGDFSSARVYLAGNNLSRFEESVFHSMLHQMSLKGGYIAASNSMIDMLWIKVFQNPS